MLTPVHSNSSASRQLANAVAGTAEAPITGTVAKGGPVKKLQDIDHISQQIAKLANLLIGSQNGLSNPLLKLALAVAKAIDFQQRPQEKIEEFLHRLADFLLAMKPEEQAAVELKSGLKSLAIPVVLLAEALKDTTTPAAAKLVVLVEKLLTGNQPTLEEHVAHSYSPKSENRPDMADSLKYRGSAPQAAILSPHLQATNESHTVPPPIKWSDIKSLQAQLVREFVDEVDQIVVSLDIETESPNLIETNYEEAAPAKDPIVLEKDFPAALDVRPDPTDKTQPKRTQPEYAPILSKGAEPASAIAPGSLAPITEFKEAVVRTDRLSIDPPIHDDGSVSERMVHSDVDGLHVDSPKSEPTLKSALLTIISDRIARIVGLESKLAERAPGLAEPRIPSQEILHSEVRPAPLQQMQSVEKSTYFLRHEQINMAHLTTQFLKDLPKATLVKLQAIANMLETHGHPFESGSPSETSANKGLPVAKPALHDSKTLVEFMQKEEKAKPLSGKNNSILKPVERTEPNGLPARASPEDQDQKPVAAGRDRLPAALSTPAERIAQQLAMFQTVAYAPLPYPIVDEPDHRSKVHNEERDQDRGDGEDQEESAEHENPHQRSKKEEPKPDLDVNPFAPDNELRRHPSDTERAFHMYQKMGGF